MAFLSSADTSDRRKPAAGPDWRARLILPWFGLTLPLIGIGFIALWSGASAGVADLFFVSQDIPIVGALGLALLALRFAPTRRLAALAIPIPISPRFGLAIMAATAAMIAVLGWFVVCHGYAMSMDEFMSVFDATIFRHGGVIAYLPEAWRPYAFPLQPQFTLYAAQGQGWVSLYLPVNALLRAGLDLVGASYAVGAACAVVSLVTVFSLARRFWPDRPDAAAIAALMLATSPQFLVTAMTPYAMSAHLAFNLVWLWLFTRPGWTSQVGAILVGFLATGLHQMIFHPLFAAPFVLTLWFERKWARATTFTVAYGLIALFWISYWKLVMPAGGGGLHGGMGLGFEFLFARLREMLSNFSVTGFGFMAKNLIRLIAWQNPMLPILAIAGAGAAWRAKGVLRAILASALLTLAVVWVLLPYQGHGWGYRYLHGFLGGFALIAALGWIRFTELLAPDERQGALGALVAVTVLSVAVLIPWRVVQASAMIRPYAAASRAIARTPAEVVVVDPRSLFYATDLVRNDPLLRNSPKLMDLGILQAPQLRQLCSEHTVALFERREGLALGISPGIDKPSEQHGHLAAMRTLLDQLKCGERSVPLT